MELIDVIEYCILLNGIYYIYDISTNYLAIKSKSDFLSKYRILFVLAFLGDVLMILNFQTFWLTSFYENHRYFEIFAKIALFILSMINQFLVYELDEEKNKMKGKNANPYDTYYKSDGKLSFKIVNRLYLLIIVYKFFNRNS